MIRAVVYEVTQGCFVRDLKVSEKVPVVFVYSVKDEIFEIFF